MGPFSDPSTVSQLQFLKARDRASVSKVKLSHSYQALLLCTKSCVWQLFLHFTVLLEKFSLENISLENIWLAFLVETMWLIMNSTYIIKQIECPFCKWILWHSYWYWVYLLHSFIYGDSSASFFGRGGLVAGFRVGGDSNSSFHCFTWILGLLLEIINTMRNFVLLSAPEKYL